ncbi:MAG: hypothetical protein H8D78_21055 [Chloroflexi bacterium]|nr:hypothetical protein [Chloroflexota bacterium]
MPDVEIDQSGKMDNLAKDTVLAFSNDIQHAIRIPAAAKRNLVQYLRQKGKSRTRAAILLFSAALFLLLRDALERIDRIVIDVEYEGYEDEIKGWLLSRIYQVDSGFDKARVRFQRVGKKSPAHRRALAVFRGQEPPDQVVTEQALLGMLRQ